MTRVTHDADDRAGLRRKAMDLLARREHGEAELTAKLRDRGYDAGVAAEEVARLAAEGLVDDARFAASLARSWTERGHGPRRVAWELRRRGVDDALLDRVVDRRDPAWVERARGAREKRFGAGAPADARERARQGRFLESRGYTGEQVRAALAAARDD